MPLYYNPKYAVTSPQIIHELFGLPRQTAIEMFEDREYIYLCAFRVRLFKIALNMDETDSSALIGRVTSDLGASVEHKTIETTLLQLMCDKHCQEDIGWPTSLLDCKESLPGECSYLHRNEICSQAGKI